MTPYDAAMVGVVVGGMIWGAWRGITWQVASIASLVLGYLFAHPLSAQLAPHLPGEPVVARALAMLAVYAIVSCGVFLVAWAVRATLRRMKFEAFDRHLGMVLGGLEGAIVGVVVTLFVTSLAPQTRGAIFQSPSGRIVGRVMDAVGPVLPTEIRTAVAPSWAHNGVIAAAPDAPPAYRAAAADPEVKPEPRGVEPAEADAPEADDDEPIRSRLGRAAGKAIEKRVGDGDKQPDGFRSRLGKAAGEVVEQGIKDGKAADLGGLIREGRSRLGRAAAEAVEREIEKIGEGDGRTPDRR